MKRKITAGELMEQLKTDPEYQARIKERDDAIERRMAEYRKAEAPLVQALIE